MRCKSCNVKISGHSNKKYCDNCRIEKARRPKHALENWQQDMVLSLVGLYSRKEIQEIVCCSRSSLQRFARDKGIKYFIPKYSKETIKKVSDYFVKYGIRKTKEAFPDVRVRSIIEYNPHEPKQIKWKDEELLKLLQFATIVPAKKQAKYFNRPNAHCGSIRSVWSKRFNIPAKRVNGMAYEYAKMLVTKSCPFHKVNYGAGNWVCFYVDMAQHLKPDVPAWIKKAIKSLAKYQNWLHGGNAKENIKSIMEELDD